MNRQFSIERNLTLGTYELKAVAKGLECSCSLRSFLGRSLESFLRKAKIRVSKHRWQIWVSNETGVITINRRYLRDCEEKILYLDLVHELIHVKQWSEGKDLFPKGLKYVDMPTEIEAYRLTVKEAEKIGMARKEIEEYLKVDWIDEKDHKKLVSRVIK